MPSLHLPIAEPCHADWDAMEPRQQGRFCRSCAKDVHDLGAMTEPEARALLQARAGERLCVRYGVGTDGRIRFRAAAAVALAGALAACTPHAQPERAAPDATPTAADAPLPVVPDLEAYPEIMGEAPAVPEPKPVPSPHPMMGGITAPKPPVQHVKGEIAIAGEPCDPLLGPDDVLPRFHDGMR